ncbi:DNA repair protein RecO [Marinococcus sp. PL1-022]|jgi:DNA repair protein RecO (recombination protein O)|uniref:DNA repair protein RecO n=1 Tax=Marinococcus sp. PL1-022 TaxID=3095363 RepID=UPI0026313F61|nr:DNA repair protein RecO [Marinococcus sp. PL1-022]MDX6153325.1 DNA repair protein RecO [Marinococcus sp. PL1-022]
MIQKTEGIVLRTASYGESNVVLTVYTREHGKMAMMAKGAKKPSSRLRSISQPFVYGTFVYYPGKGMRTLSQGDVTDSFRSVREDIVLTSYASYLSELLDKVTVDQERNPYLFELFWQLLRRIDEGEDAEVLIRLFEVKMTAVAGIQPVIDRCVNCGRQEGTFHFSIREAGFLCHLCWEMDPYRFRIQPKTVRLLRTFFYIDVHRIGSVSVSAETKKELKDVLNSYYDSYAGIHLKARRFLEQMEKWNVE